MGKNWTLVVEALGRGRLAVPMEVELPAECKAANLTEAGSGRAIPCQVAGKTLSFLLCNLAAGQKAEFSVAPCDQPAPAACAAHQGHGVAIAEGKSCLSLTVGGIPFAQYNYASGGQYDVPARPYFFPIHGAGGVLMARQFPMVRGVAGETQDHPHHRGLYVAYGDVNGADNWSEQPGHGFQVHRGFRSIASGPACGEFVEELDWQDKEHKKLMSEERTFRVWWTPPFLRVCDLTVTFKATDGPVVLGDTKEGGICSIRVPTSMDGDKGGRIENAACGVGERETWGKRAHWVDYSGVVGGSHVGVAILDHPLNLRHPSYWHVRDYGLFTANPFGLSHYKSSFQTNGDYRIEAGGALTFRYRVIFHPGDAECGSIAKRFQDYAHPPKASWKE